jgi:mono/diheme cytochrome c family protein
MARAEAPQPSSQRDLATQVRGVFAARCAGCHGPNLAKPKGRFGYVLDLARVAGNPEMVVRGQPEESELWELVRRREMPPADSPTGALSAQQKEVIRSWIAGGAPSAPSPGTDDASNTSSPSETPVEPASTPVDWHFLLWLGKFHLLVLHFPIALLVTAAAAEFWFLLRKAESTSREVRFCVLLGAASALVTAALGWLFALGGHGAGMPTTLAWHRWLGTAAATWAIGTAVCFECDVRRGTRSLWSRCLLFLGALLVGLAAHFGGILVNGADFFAW